LGLTAILDEDERTVVLDALQAWLDFAHAQYDTEDLHRYRAAAYRLEDKLGSVDVLQSIGRSTTT